MDGIDLICVILLENKATLKMKLQSLIIKSNAKLYDVKLIASFSLIILIYFSFFSCTNSNNNIVSKNDSTTINKIKRNDTICINSSKKDSNIFVYEELDGWLKLSLDEKILKNNLGKPEKKGKDEYMGATGTYIQEWDYKSKGIKFDMESDTIGIPKHIFSITIKSPSKLKTKQNIGIESEENVVREKYSKQISKEFSDKETIVVGSIYGGTIFKIKNGKVTEIFIGADND